MPLGFGTCPWHLRLVPLSAVSQHADLAQTGVTSKDLRDFQEEQSKPVPLLNTV